MLFSDSLEATIKSRRINDLQPSVGGQSADRD